MFVLHTSNRAENLIEHLSKILEAPQKDVFAKELFLIQSQGMERWLSQQLADNRGLWANFEYLFPAHFFNQISKNLNLPLEQDLFSRDNLLWKFEAQLRDLKSSELQPLKGYLQGGNSDRKRYQLAQQLAYLFDQYMFMRPDWLSAWKRGEKVSFPLESEVIDQAQAWQSTLWQQLIGTIDPEKSKHRGELWLDAIEHLKNERVGSLEESLPERISVLGINTLSPLYLGYLQALSKHIPVHFFLLNPCQEFWADSNKAVKAQLNKQSVNTVSVNDTDVSPINPLLGMLGQQGRDFQALLLEQQSNEIEISSFDAPETGGCLTILSQIQNDILQNQSGRKDFNFSDTDQSISIHACHTRMREIEVLKDQLIAGFDGDLSVGLRDVVVMAPDIQLYLPYINAVFDDIPYAVADRSLRQTSQLLELLLRFFELSQSRMLWDEVLGLLEEPVVRERFGLFEADMLTVSHWVQATRIRWGESADHRVSFGVGAFSENSWEAGLERLLMGYAVPSDEQFSDGVLPFTDIEGSQAQILGNFYAFFKLLKRARKQLAQERPLSQWLVVIREYSGLLLLENNELQRQWDGLRELFENLTESAEVHTQSLSLVVVIEHLKSLANEQKTATGFMRGQLTFCSMLPMRAIPFSTIALLGMNEGEFPKVDGRAAFDLMDNDFRRGDRSRRADERYQFLEILVSSRKQLLISYVGQSIKNNEEIPPSVVVSELLDVFEQYYGISSDQVLVKHPLQAFNKQYFLPDSALFSYSKTAAEMAISLQQSTEDAEGFWWQGELQEREKPAEKMRVDLEDLFRFYHHPQRYFAEKHLNLRLQQEQEGVNSSEVFELNNLDKFFVNQEWLGRELDADGSKIIDDAELLKRLKSEGRWLPGPLGDKLFAEMSGELKNFVSKIRNLSVGNKQDDRFIDYEIGKAKHRYQLVGKLQNNFENGNLLYRYARCKPRDQLVAWLNHLIMLNDDVSAQRTDVTYLMQMDEFAKFTAIENANKRLLDMLDIYRAAQTSLSHFILPAAFSWAEFNLKPSNRSKKTPQQIALDAFNKDLAYDSYWQLIYRNASVETVFETENFQKAISSIVEPLLSNKQAIVY